MTDRKPYKLRFHIGFLLHDVARLRGTTIDKALKPLGITRSQWWLLVCLSQFERGTVNQKQLATSMQATEVAIGELLSVLIRSGHVRRSIDTEDRRRKLIVLTDRGYDVLTQSRQLAAKINKQILKGVPKEDLAAAERVLRQMRTNILAQPTEPP